MKTIILLIGILTIGCSSTRNSVNFKCPMWSYNLKHKAMESSTNKFLNELLISGNSDNYVLAGAVAFSTQASPLCALSNGNGNGYGYGYGDGDGDGDGYGYACGYGYRSGSGSGYRSGNVDKFIK